jgi:hypothetical protein
MKTIDLIALNLQEMDHQQIKTTDGGIAAAVAWLVIGICVSEMLDRGSNGDFWNGYNAARR